MSVTQRVTNVTQCKNPETLANTGFFEACYPVTHVTRVYEPIYGEFYFFSVSEESRCKKSIEKIFAKKVGNWVTEARNPCNYWIFPLPVFGNIRVTRVTERSKTWTIIRKSAR